MTARKLKPIEERNPYAAAVMASFDKLTEDQKQIAADCCQIVNDAMGHLASPIAPYNHGVLDTKIVILEAIKQRFGL